MSFRTAAAFVVLALVGLNTSAYAHAHLRSAQPPVNGAVPAGVQDIRITYSEAVEPRFCQVTVTGPDGKPVPAGQPTTAQGDGKILAIHFEHPLSPGAYKVTWHATSVDTHKTEGSYGFTIAP